MKLLAPCGLFLLLISGKSLGSDAAVADWRSIDVQATDGYFMHATAPVNRLTELEVRHGNCVVRFTDQQLAVEAVPTLQTLQLILDGDGPGADTLELEFIFDDQKNDVQRDGRVEWMLKDCAVVRRRIFLKGQRMIETVFGDTKTH